MQSENLPDTEMEPSNAGERPSSRKKALLIWGHALTFALGLALLAYVIYRIGYQSTLESVSKVGWGFVLIVFFNLLRHCLRSASMYLAISPEVRTFKYRHAVAARFGGEAVTFFSFTGPFLGDAMKAVLLKKNLSLTHGAAAVIIDNILYYVTVILVVLGGVAILLFNYGSSGSTMSKVLFAIVVVAVMIFVGIWLAIMYRITPLTHMIDLMHKRGWAPGFLLKRRQSILDVEKNVFHFYHKRPVDFVTVFSISLGVHAVSVAEVYYALKFLGYEPSLTTSFIIESLTKVINAVFGFIPGTIGVYEGGNGLILQTLGYTVAVGVALALVRRGAILISTTLGLVILLWRTASRGVRHLADRRS